MSLRDLKKHLRAHGCELLREGKEHSIYINPANGKTAAVPRHVEIATVTGRKICDELEIPRMAGR
ncbi:MAG: type II toxin-antitoxin system HicA family toxin [Fimbriimonas sp.]